MNDTLIANWNARVAPDDQVFHIGDFCFKNSAGGKEGEGLIHKASYYTDQLNGNIIFIKGNHDRNNSVKTIIENLVIKYGPHYVNLVHNPEHCNTNFSINLVGHVHEKWVFQRIFNPSENRYTDLINMSVDVWNYKPVSFEEIYSQYRRFLKGVKKRPDVDS